jgi:t-SNARE complex subunit (syntaxin)
MDNEEEEDVMDNDEEEEEMTDMEILVHEVRGIRTILVFMLLLILITILLYVIFAFQLAGSLSL